MIEIIVFIVFILAGISYSLPLILTSKLKSENSATAFIFRFSIIGLIGYILFFVSSITMLNSNFVANIITLLQFFVFLQFAHRLGVSKQLLGVFGVISILITLYSASQNDINKIDDVNFTYCNIIYNSILFYLLKLNFENKRVIKYNETFLFALLFITISSKLILGIFEHEIRSQISLFSFFLVIAFNLITIIQNLGFYYSLWKLKEA